jgi:hypothetical protein
VSNSSKGKPRTAGSADSISVSEFCRILRISRACYYQGVKTGRWPSAYNGIPLADAQAFLNKRVAEAAALAKKLRPSTEPTDVGAAGE